MHIRTIPLSGIIAFVTLVGACDASSQKHGATIIQEAPIANEQRCPGGGGLVRRRDAPEDKNRNGYLCEDPRQGDAVRDDRADVWFFPRGELFAGQRRGNTGPLPGDTTDQDGFLGGHGPLAKFRERIRSLNPALDSAFRRDFVSCYGEQGRSSRDPMLSISPEVAGHDAGGRKRVLSGPDTRLCLTRDAVPRPNGELYVLNQSVTIGHDSSGAVGAWRTWVTVFDAGADSNAAPVRSFDVAAPRAGASTGFAVDPEGRAYIGSGPWQERSRGSIDVFAARADGNVPPVRTIYGQKGVHTPVGIAVDPWDSLYVTNQQFAAIRVYPPRAKADSPAARLLGGLSTGLVIPTGLAFDRQRRLFVSDHAADLRIFERGATGDVEPWRVISPHYRFSGLGDPQHLTIDSRGSLYVRGRRGAGVYPSDAFGESEPAKFMAGDSAPALFAVDWVDRVYVLRRDTVSVFDPGGWMSRAPSRMLAVPAGMTDMVVDRSGWLYLANGDSSFVAVYPPWARGNAAPARSIAGDRTRISRPSDLALDRHDNLYVVNGVQPPGPVAVRVYGPGASGEAQPIRIITGSRTGIRSVWDIALDSRGDIYVADGDRLEVFEAGADGDVAPSRVLTGLERVRRIAIGRGDTLYVLSGDDMPRFFSGPMSRRPRREVTMAVYAPMAGGDAAPVRTIAITRGGKSEGWASGGFLTPSGMAVDSTGAIHLSFCYPRPLVATYETGASGAVAPTRVVEQVDTAAAFTGPAGLTSACWGGFRVVGSSSPP